MSRSARCRGGSPATRRAWTVLELLRWTTAHFAELGIETPRLDAECLLAHALGVDRLRLYLDFDKPVGEAERARFRELVRRGRDRARAGRAADRAQGVLVALAARHARRADAAPGDRDARGGRARACCGGLATRARSSTSAPASGAVALALAHELPEARVTATDLARQRSRSRDRMPKSSAWRSASRSWRGPASRGAGAALRPDRVESALCRPASARRLPPELAHEPELALFAGRDGTGAAAAPRAPARRAGSRRAERWRSSIAPDQADAVAAAWCRGGRGLRYIGIWRATSRPRLGRAADGRALRRRVGMDSDRGSGQRAAARGGRGLRLEELRARADGGGAARRRGETLLANVPRLRDVDTMLEILRALGVRADWDGERSHAVRIDARASTAPRRPTTWCARCAPRSWCSVRCSPAAATRASPSPAAARSACGRSTST